MRPETLRARQSQLAFLVWKVDVGILDSLCRVQRKAMVPGRVIPLASARRPILAPAFQRKCRAEFVLASFLAVINISGARDGIRQCNTGEFVEMFRQIVPVGPPARVDLIAQLK